MIRSDDISFEFFKSMIESRLILGHCRMITGQKKSNLSGPAGLKVFLYREKLARSLQVLQLIKSIVYVL